VYAILTPSIYRFKLKSETPALEAERISASVKPFLALKSKETEELRGYLVTFADRANNYGNAERNRIRNTLDAVLHRAVLQISLLKLSCANFLAGRRLAAAAG